MWLLDGIIFKAHVVHQVDHEPHGVGGHHVGVKVLGEYAVVN